MSLNVGNCPTCGKVFAKGTRTVCPACHNEIERQFVLCEKYLRENRKANLQELSDETEVPIKLITRFIKEGRISVYNSPNLHINCDVCGQPMTGGAMCYNCRHRLSHDVLNAAKQESAKIEEAKRASIVFQAKKEE